MDSVLENWVKTAENLLNDTAEQAKYNHDDAGPDTELEYWRLRMAQLNSISDQLKGPHAKVVLGICGAGRTKHLKKWRDLDLKVRATGSLF